MFKISFNNNSLKIHRILSGDCSYPSWRYTFILEEKLYYFRHRTFLKSVSQYFPGDRLISLRTDFQWPSHSPDLSPGDYFLWGYMKGKVYEDNPQTIEALKTIIRREIRGIPQEMCPRVVQNFNVRVATVIQRRGAQMEDVINYSAVGLKNWPNKYKLISQWSRCWCIIMTNFFFKMLSLKEVLNI